MNFLGHCLFSDQSPAALVGSLWPDFGQRPTTHASGVFLQHFDRHQAIDKFTDQCKELEPMRLKLRPVFRKTTPLVIDVLIDHYLASNWSNMHRTPLTDFAEYCYQQLMLFEEFPVNKRFEQTRFWMSEHDWFSAYATEIGIERALKGISMRIKFDNPLTTQAYQACTIVSPYENCFSDYLSSLTLHLEVNNL